MKTIIFYRLVFLMSIITIVFLAYQYQLVHDLYVDMNTKSISQSDSINQIINIIKNTNSIKYAKLNNNSLKNITTGQLVGISSLLQSPTNINIVYRMMDTSCGSCNIKQIKKISMLQDLDNTIILSNKSNAREILWLMKENKITANIYQIEKQDKLFSEDDLSRTLLSFVCNDGTILRAYSLKEEDLFFIDRIIVSRLSKNLTQ